MNAVPQFDDPARPVGEQDDDPQVRVVGHVGDREREGSGRIVPPADDLLQLLAGRLDGVRLADVDPAAGLEILPVLVEAGEVAERRRSEGYDAVGRRRLGRTNGVRRGHFGNLARRLSCLDLPA